VKPPSPASPAPSRPGRWQLGLVLSAQYFTGGQRLIAGDAALSARLGRWLMGEIRTGAGSGPDQPLPLGSLRVRSASVAAAAGPYLRWSAGRVDVAFLFAAEAIAAWYRTDFRDGTGRTASLGALLVSLEPRLTVAVTRSLSVVAAVAAGPLVHGILVQSEGSKMNSISGVALSARVGAAVSF
jgi:hypothetical protein